MDRRTFTKFTLASGLSAPFVTRGIPVWASHDGSGSNERDDNNGGDYEKDTRSRIHVHTTTEQVDIDWILIYTPAQTLGVDVRQPVKGKPTPRAGSGISPSVNPDLGPALEWRFRKAQEVGTFYLVDSMLVLVPSVSLPNQVDRVTMTDGETIWEPENYPKPVQPIDRMETRVISGGGPFGPAMMAHREILGILG